MWQIRDQNRGAEEWLEPEPMGPDRSGWGQACLRPATGHGTRPEPWERGPVRDGTHREPEGRGGSGKKGKSADHRVPRPVPVPVWGIGVGGAAVLVPPHCRESATLRPADPMVCGIGRAKQTSGKFAALVLAGAFRFELTLGVIHVMLTEFTKRQPAQRYEKP